MHGEIDGVDHINWSIPGTEIALYKDEVTRQAYEDWVEQVLDWKPDVLIECVGSVCTTSWPWNPYDTSMLDMCAKYIAPAMYAYHKTELPRICIINDPRSYPNNFEMTYWPECRPVALLSQENNDWTRKIKGRDWRVRATYAGCENWWSYKLERNRSTRENPCTIIAHAHMKDNRINRQRQDVWEWILDGLSDEVDYVVHGKGWEHFNGYDPERMLGPVHPDEVFVKLQQAVCGPMIPIFHGFATAKLRQYALSGAVPFPYGRGEEWLTYDVQGHNVSLDDELRFTDTDELIALIKKANNSPDWADEQATRICDATEPDWTKLVECVEHFGNGGGYEPERFGGMEQC